MGFFFTYARHCRDPRERFLALACERSRATRKRALMTRNPATWRAHGIRFWRLETGAAEIVAVLEDFQWTARATPPLHAAWEIYSLDAKSGLAAFAGYLAGDKAERAHAIFAQAFAQIPYQGPFDYNWITGCRLRK